MRRASLIRTIGLLAGGLILGATWNVLECLAQDVETVLETKPAPVDIAVVVPFEYEFWAHALRQAPNIGEPAFGLTLEALYYFAPRAHDRWRRNVFAEALASPTTWLRVEIGYDPRSALITGVGGFHASAEGLTPFAATYGAGAYARYDRAGSADAAIVTDTEFGGLFALWSKERRTFVSEKVGLRTIASDGSRPGDEGTFVQLRHHLVFVPSEDWELTFVQEGTARIGFGSDPRTNQFRAENLFLWTPLLAFTAGAIVGIDLEYRNGTATSVLSIPAGLRGEVHLGRFVIVATGLYDVPTIAGQRSAGLLIRGSAGVRF